MFVFHTNCAWHCRTVEQRSKKNSKFRCGCNVATSTTDSLRMRSVYNVVCVSAFALNKNGIVQYGGHDCVRVRRWWSANEPHHTKNFAIHAGRQSKRERERKNNTKVNNRGKVLIKWVAILNSIKGCLTKLNATLARQTGGLKS